jgi:predicted DNA-binding antitoxin AbrB/MazE fold protein
MSMQVFTARVKGGAIVPDEGVDLREGERVTVVAGDVATERSVELTPEQEAELVESIAEADRGDVISARDLFERLSR